MNPRTDRRRFLASSAGLALALAGCGNNRRAAPPSSHATVNCGRWAMPPEESRHVATWMCWPSSKAVWGKALADVQAAIARVAVTIAGYEPVKMLARPAEADRVRALLADADAQVVDGPVDDLWARDTLPLFLVSTDSADDVPLAAGRLHFNGWGGKQIHDGDTQLAEIVADHLGIPLVDSHLTGEGGGLENDGHGTILAARSSWVNDNRNPGMTEREIARRLRDLLGADRLIWVDGLAGADITDSHIDTLARFANVGRIVLGQPSYIQPGEKWYDLAVATKNTLQAANTENGHRYAFTTLVEPKTPRGKGDAFLSSYVNYYVCNGAVIAPSFGDTAADRAAASALRRLFPSREVIQVDIDAIAEGGGGIHCATQQQPSLETT